MSVVYTDNLKSGMTLGADVRTPNGRFLLPRGAVLQPVNIRTFKAWGVTEVEIVTFPDHATGPEQLTPTPELLQLSRDYLEPLFAACNQDHPATRELYRLALQRTAKRFEAGWHPVAPTIPAAADEAFELPSATKLVADQTQLASLPDVYYRIVETLNSPGSSASQIAEVVSRDPNLAARLLRLVNSAFYGFPVRIDSISRAVTLLGGNELSTLALGISLLKNFDTIPAGLIDMQAFWEHSIACGVITRLLAAHKPGLSAETFFVGGLLHDIGHLILLKHAPTAALQALQQAAFNRLPFFQAERQLLGFDHARLGMLLARDWRLPQSLEAMIGNHHQPGRGRYADEVCILHLADILAFFVNGGYLTHLLIPPLDSRAWEQLGFTPDILAPVLNQADRQVKEMLRLFLPSPQPMAKQA